MVHIINEGICTGEGGEECYHNLNLFYISLIE